MGDIISRAIGVVLFLGFMLPYVLKIGALPLTLCILITAVLMVADAMADTGWGGFKG